MVRTVFFILLYHIHTIYAADLRNFSLIKTQAFAETCSDYLLDTTVTICTGNSYFAGGNNQTESGDYYDYYITVGGCDSTIITHLTVELPIVDLGGDVIYCDNTLYTLDAGNVGSTYLWNTGATSQIIPVTASGTYSVVVTDSYGCVGTDAISATLFAASYVDLGADTIGCAGTPITLDASTPFCTYVWNTGAHTSTIHVNIEGTYSVIITNLSGCQDTDNITVTFLPAPEVHLTIPTDTVCLYDNAFLLSGGEPTGGIYSGDGISLGTFNPAIAGTGTHTVSYTYTNNVGCSTSASVSLVVDICNTIQNTPELNALELFPNPASNYITLQYSDAPQAIFKIYVYTSTGVLINAYRYIQGTQLPIQYLPAGIYLIKIEVGNIHVYKQLIKL